jgi:hypothetical protein
MNHICPNNIFQTTVRNVWDIQTNVKCLMNELNVLGETDRLRICEDFNLPLGGVKMLRNVILEECTGLSALKYINCNDLSEICPNVILALTFSRLMTYIYILVCRDAPLTSRRCILYIYSTNKHTDYFKHAAYSPFFPLQNVVYFVMLPFLVPVLFTF